jgi:hypothetical protein
MVNRSTYRLFACTASLLLATAVPLIAGPAQVHISQADINPGYTITEPGTYIVTENLTVPSTVTDGIAVSASDVLIDLNGHTITAHPDNFGAIFQTAGQHRLTIRNGVIVGFNRTNAQGVYIPGAGNVVESLQVIDCREAVWTGQSALVRDVTVTGQGALTGSGFGVRAGDQARIENVSVQLGLFTVAYTGIVTGARSIVHRSQVTDSVGNSSFTAIHVGPASVVSESNAIDNGGGLTASGIAAGSNSVVRAVQAINHDGFVGAGINLAGAGVVADAVASGNAGAGIQAGPAALVIDSRAHQNTVAGINLNGHSMALRNQANGNGVEAAGGAGIIAAAAGNRIENNHTLGNQSGIRLNAERNLVTGNRTGGNITTNILITTTPNHVGLRREVTGSFMEKNGMANLDY